MTIPPVLGSVLRTAAVTFAGAFLGALVITKIPNSWSGLWADVAPAMLAAIVAEVAYLRSVFAKTQTDAVKRAAGIISTVALVGLLGGSTVATQEGCTPAQFAELTQLEQDVSAGLAAGDSDAVLASIVCRDLGGSTTTDAVCADAATILADTIALLVDGHWIGGVALAHGREFRARKAAGQ